MWASGPPSTPALAIPNPQHSNDRDPRGRGRRLRDPGSHHPLPGTSHPSLLGMCCLCAQPGPGSQATTRESWDRKVYLSRSKLGRTGSQPALAPPLGPSAFPGEDRSFLFSEIRPGLLSCHSFQGSTNARAPGSWDKPAAQPQTPGSVRGQESRSRRSALAGPLSRLRPALEALAAAASQLRGILLRPR